MNPDYLKEQVKPPLGPPPRHLHEEQRMQRISDAIARYSEVYKPIPVEWVEEYNELATRRIPNEHSCQI